MKVLVTGASGFLGNAVARRLAGRHDLRLLVRPTSRRDTLPEGVELVEGDLRDGASLERALAGCEAVIHAAALVKLVAPSSQFDDVNVAGLERLLDGLSGSGVERLVYVSSFIALGPSDDAERALLDEQAHPFDRDWINDYERTKTIADRAARAAIADGMPVSIVYPGVIYGPGAMTEGNLVVRGLLELLHGRVPALVGDPTRLWSYVHVDDVAAGIVDVLEEAPTGSRYVLAGDNVTLADFYRTIEEISGVEVPARWMPRKLALGLGWALKSWARVTGGVPKLTPDMVEVCFHDWAYSSDAARRDLGYEPRSLHQGLEETIDWLEETGAWTR